MKHFTSHSIKAKLVLMIWLITLAALLIGFSIIIYRDVAVSRQALIHEIELSASLIAETSAGALYFEDKPGVISALSKMDNIPVIKQVSVYDLRGNLFATHQSRASNPPQVSIKITHHLEFGDSTLLLVRPIHYQDSPLGFISVEASTRALRSKTKDYLVTMLELMLILMLFAYLLANRFQRFISEPIIALTDVTQKISLAGDYTTRVQKQSMDEIGGLYDGFNSMLDKIQQRESERNQARRALEQSQKSLNRAQQIAHIGSFTGNAKKVLFHFSDELYRIYGWPIPDQAAQLTLEQVFSSVHPDDRERVQKTSEAAIKKGKSFSGEYRIIRPDQTECWVRCMIVPQVDKKGHVLSLMGTVQDISESKAAERALEQGEQKYRSFIDNSNDAIYLLYQGKFEMVNDRFLEMFEINRETLDDPDFNFMNLVDAQSYSFLKEREQKIEAGEAVENRYEFIGLTSTKRAINLEVNVSYIPYREGTAVQGFLRDITDRIALEDQLRQAQKMEAIGRLSGGIAHDFNNLLTIILGYCELAAVKVEPTHPVLKSIEQISKAGKRAEALTRQLLAFSRRQVIQPVVLNINQLIMDLHKMLQRLIGEDVELVTLLHENSGLIKADPGQMEQIIMNLSVNARDAMLDGGRLTLETKNVTIGKQGDHNSKTLESGSYVCLLVRDTGIGIAKEMQEQIFEPFFTTKEQGKGTGLGLSTVYGIVQQNQGSIQVQSEPGKGTTFLIYFPVVDSEQTELSATEGQEVKIQGSERILIVEDVEGLKQLAAATVSEQGYSVMTASNGEEALLLFEKEKGAFDLLLTDVVMPGINGKKLSDILKDKNPELKVLFMSGYTDDAIVHHGVLHENISFIQKPFTPTALLQKIRTVIDET